MSELVADNIFRFWAKLPQPKDPQHSNKHSTSPVTPPTEFHPLICHMLDVAAVTREIWRNVLPMVARERIANALGLSIEQAEVWVMFLAALHDLGKASPAFQLRDAAEHLLELYKDMGERPTGIKPSDIPHGRVTVGELPNDLMEKLALKANLAQQLSTIIGGHHGSFPTSVELENNYLPKGVGGKAWQKVRQEFVRILFEFFNVPEILKAN
ncbi:MAG: CRISPR-associated helicase Cas3, partial [bacterium]